MNKIMNAVFHQSKYLLIGIFLFSTPIISIADEQPEHLSNFLKDLETFSAAFEQISLNQFGEELEKSVGVMHIRRPGMFHWAYWEPYVQYLISDGVNLWIYDEDLEQVTIRDISNVIEDSPAAILGGEIDIDAHYVVINLDTTDGNDWVEMTPRDVESQYSSIQLGFKDSQLYSMILLDHLGQTTVIKLLDMKRNNALNIELFQFTVPEGVDVIDSRQ
ncbi:MAG: outer membrane lipoprotein chaperone LolA [Gammaproteobacteria bacterium]|jgi:outer membrane lipoprotein carrier protein|nr:outer membrane lipoprotein chaperone LolA [Gammaproteobacteria bacterium]